MTIGVKTAPSISNMASVRPAAANLDFDALQDLGIHAVAIAQGNVTQRLGTRQRVVLQTAEQLSDFLLQAIPGLVAFGAGADAVAGGFDLLDQDGRSLDECT